MREEGLSGGGLSFGRQGTWGEGVGRCSTDMDGLEQKEEILRNLSEGGGFFGGLVLWGCWGCVGGVVWGGDDKERSPS